MVSGQLVVSVVQSCPGQSVTVSLQDVSRRILSHVSSDVTTAPLPDPISVIAPAVTTLSVCVRSVVVSLSDCQLLVLVLLETL